jgi:UDP-N-acetylmuramoylalanine--D-glutamate ligase
MIPLEFAHDGTYGVFGLARSGLAAARALQAAGAEVLAWDDDATRRAQAAASGIAVANLATADFARLDALVLSPGVPLTHPEPHWTVRAAQAAGCPVIGDIELFARAGLPARTVGITGTNGKSTTTALIGHILRRCGMSCEVGGNIGRAALEFEALDGAGVYVLELSSYQLDLTDSLALDIAVLLNITPDHLDRHGGMAGYIAAKRRVFNGQTAEDIAVIGIDDAPCAALREELAGGPQRVIPVSVAGTAEGGVWVAGDGTLIDDLDGAREAVAGLAGIATLPGAHNWQNAAAAYAAMRGLGLARADILAALADFPGLAHRQELVAGRRGIGFVNDSKATNAEAAARALASYDAVYWIAGGVAKAGGIESLRPLFPRIRKAYLIGAAAGTFADTLGAAVPHARCETLERALAAAWKDARDAGEPAVVLLSPACASFDQFKDFEARGDAFRAAVHKLLAGEAA